MSSKANISLCVSALTLLVTSSLLACGDTQPTSPEVLTAALGESSDPHVLAVPGTTTSIPLTQYTYTYVRLDVPVGHEGLRVAVKTTTDASLTLRRDAHNGTDVGYSSSLRVNTIFVPQATVGASTSFFLLIYSTQPAGTAEVQAEAVYARPLSWDPGTAFGGTNVVTKPAGAFGDHLYTITAQASTWRAWRTVVNVTAGEADLYIAQNSLPTSPSYGGNKDGSDGFVLGQNEFAASQTWFVRVVDRSGTSDWNLFSGEIHVTDYGALGDAASTPDTLQVGPEGAAYFRTTVGVDTRAWRITSPGSTIYINDDYAPIARQNYFDIKDEDASLQVPTYLTSSQYIVAIAPRSALATVSVESRRQPITTPGDGFTFDITDTISGPGTWVTYRVDVPVNQIAWQVALTPTSGSADVYVRKGNVPSATWNDGLSEAPGLITDTITHVPPDLTNTTFYVSVRGTVGTTFRLTSGSPEITLVPFFNLSGIQNDKPNQVGWRFYRVDNDDSQLNILGWLLELVAPAAGTPAPAGTEIAIRRGGVPGRYRYRQQHNSTYVYETSRVDFASRVGFLQRPNHQADFWYIGIYNPDATLNDFVLRTSPIVAEPLPLNGGAITVTNQPSGTWRYFQVVVPAKATNGFLGMDLQLFNITGEGRPRMVIRRGLLPDNFADYPWWIYQSASWETGWQWAPINDITGRYYPPYVEGQPTLDVYGRRAQLQADAPLTAGTYYIGVSDVYTTPADKPLSYTVKSEGIGEAGSAGNWLQAVQTLAFNGGAVTATVPARDIAYYKVEVPAGANGWALDLDASSGESMMAVSKGRLPNSFYGSSSDGVGGARRQMLGDEYFYRYPDYNVSTLPASTYYVAVASEGQAPYSGGYIGTGSSTFTLTSTGEVPVIDSGSLDANAPLVLDNGTTPLAYGAQRAYRFAIGDPDLTSLEFHLRNVEGTAYFTASNSAFIPSPSSYSYQAHESGSGAVAQGTSLDTLLNPDGTFTVVVTTLTTPPSLNIPARFELEVVGFGSTELAFSGGPSRVVTNQPPSTWRYFTVDVPEANAGNGLLGWDLRVRNVQSGDPRMVISRGVPVESVQHNPWYIMYGSTFSEGWSYASATDMSTRAYEPYNPLGTPLQYYRTAQMGFGAPLEPGRYYVGITSGSGDPLSYELVSRAVGIGGTWETQVGTLPFEGAVQIENLEPREVAYYRVTVPEGSKSWEMELVPTTEGSEANLVVRRGNLMSQEAVSGSSDEGQPSGTRRSRVGGELFYKYPGYLGSTINGGTYYVAVASEGMNPYSGSYIGTGPVSFELRSKGEIEVGPTQELGVGTPVLWSNETLVVGALKSYRFTVAPGTKSMEVKLTPLSGAPYFNLTGPTGTFPSPYGASYFAGEGGNSAVAQGEGLYSLQSPVAGTYTFTIGTRTTPQGVPQGATFNLAVRQLGEAPLAFNGGHVRVVAQDPSTWSYFKVTVPEADTGVLGWDLALTNVTGRPRMLIRRGETLPTSFGGTNPWYFYSLAYWSVDWQWQPDVDMTGRPYEPYNPQGSDYFYGRRFTVGLGSPLSPGDYIVAISNSEASGPMSYDLDSRGIGIGNAPDQQPWTTQVRDLAFAGGTAQITDLAPRDVAFYRVNVPDGAESWGVELTPEGSGEAQMLLHQLALPNIYPVQSESTQVGSGVRRQKPGRELFYSYSRHDQLKIPSGPYYIAVLSEGHDPYSTSYIGTGAINATLRSVGVLPYADNGGDDIVTPTTPVRFEDQTLEYGAEKRYRVRVPDGVSSVRVHLEQTVGAPQFAALITPYFTGSTPANGSSYDSGEGGWNPQTSQVVSYEFVARTGDLHILVSTNSVASVPANAIYDLVIEATPVVPVEFDGGTVSASLTSAETRFYKFVVPVSCDSEPPPGWVLSLDTTSGAATIDIRRGRLPGDPLSEGASFQFSSTSRETIVSPPHFQPGVWYVAVRATGLTQFTLSSRPIAALRTWTMPLRGETAQIPNVPNSGPRFADTGYLADGQLYVNPIAGGQGIDLGQDRYHFYRVVVPEGNGGFIKSRLDAISGNPDFLMRRDAAPTQNHDAANPPYYQNLIDWYDQLTNTSFGHFAPADLRYGDELAPGKYWFAVRAVGSNVRYRLSLAVALVDDLSMTNGTVTGQSLAAGDMRFYKVTTPNTSTNAAESAPLQWHIDLAQTQNDVAVFLRERGPAGSSRSAPSITYPEGEIRDWQYDRYLYPWASWPLYRIEADGRTTIPLGLYQPGTEYYLGVYARGPYDATFSLSSSVGSEKLGLAGYVSFEKDLANSTHIVNGQLAANETHYYRIDVPADAARWLHKMTLPSGVQARLTLDTLPPASGGDWSVNGPIDNQPLDYGLYYPGGYAFNHPWRPGRSYYFAFQNTTASAQTFRLEMDGRDKTDDSDTDNLPDWWEFNAFGSLYYNGATDYDSDQLSNAAELSAGTNPIDWDSDDDTLSDGLEVSIGADPLVGDSDGDAVCDGVDSDPTDPNESGPVIRLRMNEYEGGSYGKNHGTNQHRSHLVAVFERFNSAPTAHWIHMKGWGIETAGEVKVMLNGVQIGVMPAGATGQASRPAIFYVPSGDLVSGRDNRLELIQTNAVDTPAANWGVSELGLLTYGASLGYDSTAAYDQRHPDGFLMYWPSFGNRMLELRGFDVDVAGELKVSVDGNPLFALPAGPLGANNGWTAYYQMPLHADDFAAGTNVLDVSPAAGSDGDWQLRIVETRPILTTMGNYYTSEGAHWANTVSLLLPRSTQRRQFSVDARTEEGGTITSVGSRPPDGGESPWPSGASLSPPRRIWCSDATVVDWGTMTRVPAPTGGPYFYVYSAYYGVVLDTDLDQHDDCADAFPRNIAEWDDVDEDRLGDNWERQWFNGLTVANGTSDSDGDGKIDLLEFRDLTDPVCADLDQDTYIGVNPWCATGNDCDDQDPEVGPGSNDNDCDGVTGDIDCDDSDPTVMTTNVGDADCDGVGTASDCDDADPQLGAMAADVDCDGVLNAGDCDDALTAVGSAANDVDCDGSVSGSDCNDNNPGQPSNDADCDGTVSASDCDDSDASQPSNDADCDGAATASDCDDTNPQVQVCAGCTDADGDGHGLPGASCPTGDDCNDASSISTWRAIDADCDGVATANDCDDTSAAVTKTRTGDQDCDNIATAVDCDDTNAAITTSNVGDADCDGVATASDCNDANAAITNTNVSDKDCDLVATSVDCDDNNAAVKNTNVSDKDCDLVASGVDCNDNNASVKNTTTSDKDCDLVATSIDCDDNNAGITATKVGDLDCDGVGSGVDCNDGNAAITTSRIGDADCDGIGTAVDCNDSNASVKNTNVGDADCDGVAATIDCNDASASVKNTNVGDADCDRVATTVDCNDNDASVTATRTGDADCDAVGTAIDCNDNDATITRSKVGDADCDTVGTAIDCNDNDATVTRSKVDDGDCDGVASDLDCDDDNPNIVRNNIGDQDCDGVATGLDCDDSNAGKKATSLNDADCDGTSTPIDCDDGDVGETRSKLHDADCDDVRSDLDCDDHDAGVTRTRAGDGDCDGVPSAEDCDDQDAHIATTRAADADCDGMNDGLDCAPSDPLIATSAGSDADCDGVPTLLDCADDDAADVRSNELDGDCDGVPTSLDCDDGDANAVVSTQQDGDCDGVTAAMDCDDTDPSDTTSCGACVDGDGDGAFGAGPGCARGDDCDDGDATSTVRGEDADCDGVLSVDDCDDDDDERGAGDADCDGVPSEVDCDDDDAGNTNACQERCVDADGDGHDAQSPWCAAGVDCDDHDAASTTAAEDGDCDGLVIAKDCDDEDATSGARASDGDCDGVDDLADVCPEVVDDQRDGDGDGVGDACDACPELEDDQADADDDGIGDACEDADGDEVADGDDNCPAVANDDQLDLDHDGLGDACDTPVAFKEDAGCGGGELPAALAIVAFVLVLRRRAWLALLVVFSGCGDAVKRPLGASCESAAECETGLCGGGHCLDPDLDDDLDGLVNGLEVDTLGTDPLKADTDDDGLRDGDELDSLANADSDSDGKPDALESASEDADDDCIPDQYDAEDTVDNSDLTPLFDVLCPAVGVCGVDQSLMSVKCSDGQKPTCDRSQVVGFEPIEATCDGLDNDCDGKTDEDLPANACAPVLESLVIAPDPLALWLTLKHTLTVIGHYDDGSEAPIATSDVTWQSSAASVKVEAGVVTGVGEGSARITASVGSISASIDVTVYGACAPGEESFASGCDGVTGDLVGHYRLDGDGRDTSGYFAHGSVFGAEPVADRFGSADKAMAFCESGDRIEVLDSRHPTGEVTASYTFWVRPRAGGTGDQAVLSAGRLVPGRRSSAVLSGPETCVGYAGQGNDAAASGLCVPSERWSFVAIVKDARGVSFYLNGQPIGTATTAVGQNVTSHLLQLGLAGLDADGTVHEQLCGALDDVRIYARVLSAAEVGHLYGLGGWSAVGSEGNPGRACDHVLGSGGGTADGRYWIDPDGDAAGTGPAFEAWCDMANGGWTLAWVYGFTAYDAFVSAADAVTPIPSWPAPGADVPISDRAPSGPDAPGAIAWNLWRHLGEALRVTSNVNDHVECRPASATGGTALSGGSLALGTSGPVTCEVVREVATACDGVTPVGLGWGAYGPSLAADELYYYWDGSTTASWPTHDPCGSDRPNQVLGVAVPRGALWLKH